jgi:hypothetical protein
MVRTERTPREWFEEAERCYLELHQGCAWCGGSHRVYRRQRDAATEYHCNVCDFHVSHDEESHEYQVIPGEDRVDPPPTMYEI